MNKDKLVFWTAIACLATSMCIGKAKAESQLWVTPGAVSYHVERTQDNGQRWNETNYGLGVEYEVSPQTAVMIGVYRNSLDRWTHYALVQYTPIVFGPVRFGAMVGAVDGYSSNVDPALAPVATIEGKRFGLNVSFVPKVEALKTASVVAVQFKFRF